jgi:hypothetical protein
VKNITATVGRGKNKGLSLVPHRYGEGYFVVCKGGNTLDCATKVTNVNDLESWVQRGYGIRMSAPGHSPSICMPKSLQIERV